MISQEEATVLIKEYATVLSSEEVQLGASSNRILATDILSPTDHPIFDQSAMDGYCFSFNSLSQGPTLTQFGEIQAGGDANISIGPGQCARIFTGAQLPSYCDTVIMQEQTEKLGTQITFTNAELKKGANVRRAGEQLKEGDIALHKGSLLNSASIGFLASLGIDNILVTKQPRVHIICTGNEFAQSESDLVNGKIYESNGQMLVACLAKMGIEAGFETCIDKLDQLTNLIAKREEESDLLLITGGVSVGDYDFTLPALEANNFKTIFHKISQKPGKPLLFSVKDSCTAFGLPGNPRAVIICFYEYVYDYIQKSMGDKNPGLVSLRLPLAADFRKKDDKRSYFLAATIRDGKAALLSVQGSHMLSSMADAKGLVVLPPEGRNYEVGDLVEYHILDQ